MQKLVQYLQVALVGAMTITCLQLIVTYQFFIQQAQELQFLKAEYQSYCTAYRQLLLVGKQHLAQSACTEICEELEDGLLCQECQQLFMQEPKSQELVAVPSPKPAHPLAKKFVAQWPIKRSQFWISSRFGPRKKRNGNLGFHYGLDMAALKGTPVHAVAPGRVVEALFSKKGYGKCIVIKHNNGISTRYAHLDKMFVARGARVKTGDLIGCVGATGHVRGKNDASHLHLEVMADGKHLDPLYVLA